MGEPASIELVPGSIADLPVVMSLFDSAVAWLNQIGRSDQWGSDAWGGNPRYESFVAKIVEEGELWFARIGGQVAGALVLSHHPMPYVDPASEPEIYVKILLSAPAFRGHGVGARLLDHARAVAQEQGISLVRVDCWAGGEQKLVQYYTGQGFIPVARLDVGGQPVQVFEQRIPEALQ